MSYPSTQFATSRQMGIYEPFRQVGVWRETFSGGNSSNVGASTIVEVDSRQENKVRMHEVWSVFLFLCWNHFTNDFN